MIKKRTKDEWNSLYLRRFFLILSNVCFIVLCSGTIIFTNVYKSTIVTETKEYLTLHPSLPSWLIALPELAPTIVLSVCNGVVGPVVKKTIQLEKWDYAYERVNNGVWRLWIGKMVNTMIFVTVQLQKASQREILVPSSQVTFNSESYSCREDEASMMFVQLVLNETINKGIAFAQEVVIAYVMNKRIKKIKDWQPDFKETGEIVWIIYYQMIMLTTSILFPYFVLVQPILITIVFYFYFVYL